MYRFLRHHKDFRPQHRYKKTTLLSLARLIISLGLACVTTVWAIYLESFGFSAAIIGYISGVILTITLISSIFSTPLLEKKNEYKILIVSILTGALGYLAISMFHNLYIFLIATLIATVAGVIRMDSFDILFRDQSNKKSLNEDEGLLYTLVNIGWLIGPILAGFILVEYSEQATFFAGSIFLILSTIFLSRLHITEKKKKRESIDSNIKKNLIDYITNKHLMISYIICTGINIWFALILIYVPVFIVENNLSAQIVGYFIAATVVPLVILEYPIGKLANKFGYKHFILTGFIGLTTISILAFFISNIYIILGLLVFASIFLAMIEPIQDSFFFSKVRSRDEEKYYPIYVTSTDTGSLIGRFAVATFLLFLPNNYAYLIIGILLSIITLMVAHAEEK